MNTETTDPQEDRPVNADKLRQEQTAFFTKFAQMIQSGVPLLAVLEALEAEASEPWKGLAREITESIRAGNNLSDPIGKRSDLIQRSVFLLIKAGEKSGKVGEALQNIAAGLRDGTLDVPDGSSPTAEPPVAPPPPKDPPEPVKALNEIFLKAVESRASDIHFEPTEDGGQVRLRIDGALQCFREFDRQMYRVLISRVKILSHLDVAERDLPQDGRVSLKAKGKDLDMRICTVPVAEGEGREEAATIRVMQSRGQHRLDLEAIVLEDDTREKLAAFMRKPCGIIIVTGPTGSGKTTLMYAMLRSLDAESRKIITVENPVEVSLPGIVQMPAAGKRGVGIERSLRALMRSDPDVMMVSEIRNREIIEFCIQGALTGHLVLSALHTETAPGALTRLLDMGCEPWLVRDSVLLTVGIRLVRKVCEQCRQQDDASNYPGLKLPEGTYFRAKPGGCEACNGTGFKGRMALLELCELNEAISRELGNRADGDSLYTRSRAEGMRSMFEDGILKASRGLVSILEVLRVAPRRD